MSLNDFGNTTAEKPTRNKQSSPAPSTDISRDEEDLLSAIRLTQWAICGSGEYKPVSTTFPTLDRGVYSVCSNNVHGIYFEKKKICVDDLLLFPDSVSDKILKEIQAFWIKEKSFKKHGFLHRRGYLLYGPAGCHSKGTKIIMFDGSFKNVEDIIVGDILMGPDSKSRKVLELKRGKEEMYKITPNKGESFIVNKNHILHLTPSCKNDTFKFPIDIKVSDYLTLPLCAKERFKLTRVDGITFQETKKLSIPPYILGMWLGDGTAREPAITNIDEDIITSWYDYAKEKGLHIRIDDEITHCAVGSRKKSNPITILLRELNLINNKHVPLNYLYANKENRLELIAGLLDTDGYYRQNCYSFCNKNENIADSMMYLCRSVGLAAYKSITKKGCWYKNRYKEGIYYIISISGNVNIIPCKVDRKQAEKRKQNKNVLRVGFKIESSNIDEYYGFILNNDHLYLTSDFVIHHNSGKTCIIHQVMHDIEEAGGLVFQCDCHPALFNSGLSLFREIEPERPVVCLFEDIDAIIASHGEDEILALLDGENQINRVLNIGTTNYPERLDKRLVARPRRFDRVIKVDMPPETVRRLYFAKKLNVDEQDLDKWVKATEGFSFAALAELVISVCCFENPFDESVARLDEMMHANVSSKDYDYASKVGFGAGR